MDLSIEERGAGSGYGIVALAGRLNGASAPEFKRRFQELMDAGPSRFVLDLSALEFIDSSGLSALISALKRVREAQGSLRLAGLKDQALSVIRLTRLDRVFEIYPDAEAASR